MITWAPQEEEVGFDRGVLYLAEGAFPWNGLVDITEHGDDSAVQTDLYFEGRRFAFTQSPDDFSFGISSWSYPVEFEPYEGHGSPAYALGVYGQVRRPFGMSYREGYWLHLVWNITAIPSEVIHSSRNNEFEITQFAWEFVTTKKNVSGAAPTAHFQIDTRFAPAGALHDLEVQLYGGPSSDPYLPEPDDVVNLFLDYAILVVTDNLDGTATITGPDEAIEDIGGNKFRIEWPSVHYISDTTVNISSM